ncbi:helix-turn-helix domain-containing protein [Thalassotalea ganghwensis]
MQFSPNNLSPERIKKFRTDKGWSQEVLAKASGLSLRTVQRAEKNGNSSAETQLALAAAFDISPKALFIASSNPDVNWKRKNIMQSFIALVIMSAAIAMLFMLGGEFRMFADWASALFLLLMMYSGTAIAFGTHGLVKSLSGLSYLFANDIAHSPATEYLSTIYQKQITFLYGGAFIGVLIGVIAINSNLPQIDDKYGLSAAYAVCLIVLLYAAILAEVIFRPLATKLASTDLIERFS